MSKYNSYDSPTRPDSNCRSCTDFKTWSRKQREISQIISSKNAIDTQHKKEFHNNSNSGRADCPLDKDSLGRSSWGLLHTMAAVYPDKPTEKQQRDVRVFFDTLSRLYPCDYCAKGIQSELISHPVKSGSHREFSQWLCMFHNRVNRKLGKPQFDCSKVDERWKDGWKDGSCD